MESSSSHRSGAARGVSSRGTARRRPLHRGIASLLLILQFTGCFHYVPAPGSALRDGTVVSIGLTDAGRIALTEAIGPGVLELGGKVIASDDSTLVLAVSTVEYLDVDTPVRWSGERVAVPRQFVSTVRERQLSKSRSWLMAGVLVVGAALLSTLAIVGFGSDTEDGGGDNDDQ